MPKTINDLIKKSLHIVALFFIGCMSEKGKKLKYDDQQSIVRETIAVIEVSNSIDSLQMVVDRLDSYLFMIKALEAIHPDSLEIHAPLARVNQVITEYNNYVASYNASTCPLIHLSSTSNYSDTNKEIELMLTNYLSILNSFRIQTFEEADKVLDNKNK